MGSTDFCFFSCTLQALIIYILLNLVTYLSKHEKFCRWGKLGADPWMGASKKKKRKKTKDKKAKN